MERLKNVRNRLMNADKFGIRLSGGSYGGSNSEVEDLEEEEPEVFNWNTGYKVAREQVVGTQ
jgi:hypothetical protein